MMRARVVLLGVSLVVVLAFSGFLLASLGTDEVMFRSLGTLSEVVHLVLTDYVDALDQDALASSLDAGLVEAFDPAAAVLPAEAVEPYQRLVAAPPAYGLLLGFRLGSAAVRHTVAGSPAAAAGLQPGEVVERVEGENTRGRPLWQIRLDLARRFEQGEAAHLTVVDRLVDERREVVLDPSVWQPEVAVLEEREGAVVVRVTSLPEGGAERVRDLVAADRPLVLDLRRLVWGSEDEAVRVADLFVGAGTLAAWRGRRAGEKIFDADPALVTSHLPVVLISFDTEGAGEILAAALDRAGANLVGQRTAGHASHMRLVRDGDLSLWLPVAYWLRADGTAIHGEGVVPDEPLDAPEEGSAADPVLDRGLELARGALAAAA